MHSFYKLVQELVSRKHYKESILPCPEFIRDILYIIACINTLNQDCSKCFIELGLCLCSCTLPKEWNTFNAITCFDVISNMLATIGLICFWKNSVQCFRYAFFSV